MTHSVSVIIPTRNAGQRLPALLEALGRQTRKAGEVIVIDSESKDDTLEISRRYGCRILRVRRKDFDHGGTRTIAAKNAGGDLLVYMTQDVALCDEDCIENLLRGLTNDDETGAVFGRQLAHTNATFFARNLRRFNYPDSPHMRTTGEQVRLGPRTVLLSNSFAAYDKAILKSVGYFQAGLIFGEDMHTAARMLLRGYKIAYTPDARVFHSHNWTVSQEFKRCFDMGVFDSNEDWLSKEFGKAEKRGIEYAKHELRSLVRERAFSLLPELILRDLVRFSGYKIGTRHIHLPRSINRRFSMNRTWWDQKKDS